jgi:MraZ protein
MFLGTYSPRLDDKGRVILPSKFRDQLAAGLVVTRGQERCLVVYPQPEYERVLAQLAQAPTTNKLVRDYKRLFTSSASDEVPDKQGRITLPVTLREYAGLDREPAVIGAGERVEIWDAESWSRYLTEQESQFAETAEELIPGVF